jgi:uncharacterized membrane protein
MRLSKINSMEIQLSIPSIKNEKNIQVLQVLIKLFTLNWILLNVT